MAEILITNIEIPEGKKGLTFEVNRHGEVFVFYGDESTGYVAPLKRRESKAVFLPPHGDLINKQETVKKLMDSMCEGCKHTDDCSWCAMAEYRRIVEDAPTVLEATE